MLKLLYHVLLLRLMMGYASVIGAVGETDQRRQMLLSTDWVAGPSHSVRGHLHPPHLWSTGSVAGEPVRPWWSVTGGPCPTRQSSIRFGLPKLLRDYD